MIDITYYKGRDFARVAEFEGWAIGILRYSSRFDELKALERHNLTDEAFILLEGSATLYVSGDAKDIKSYEMEKNKVYNIHKAIWHNIVVSEDATVLIVENSNTAKENSEYIDL